MLLNCNVTSYAINKQRMVQLAEYSRDCIKALRASTNIEYQGRQQGTLQLFRDEQQYAAAHKDIAVLQQAGVPYELLNAAELAEVEPGLAGVIHKLTGGLRLPNDETGDCQMFTTKLAALAAQLGVKFQYGVSIDGLQLSGNQISAVQCGATTVTADAYVVALGSYSSGFLKGLLEVPVYPVKGYSITVPIVDPAKAPVSTIIDETYKIAITRFDDRIRVGGMAELVGFNRDLNPKRERTLEMVLNDLFPGAGDLRQTNFWTGLRPMTPDGTPLVGKTRIPNLFLNTGHGTLGWTMSCGSGSVLADIISGRAPAVDAGALNLARYT